MIRLKPLLLGMAEIHKMTYHIQNGLQVFTGLENHYIFNSIKTGIAKKNFEPQKLTNQAVH
jgi:hypothetical protein